MKPTIGRIVIYTLSDQDAIEINRRRTSAQAIKDRIKTEQWLLGAQAHIGNRVEAGQKFPLIIVAVWSDTCINGQVLLDGNDTFWALSRSPGNNHMEWQWPTRD